MRRDTRIWTVLVLLALLLAGCGASDSGGESAAEDAAMGGGEVAVGGAAVQPDGGGDGGGDAGGADAADDRAAEPVGPDDVVLTAAGGDRIVRDGTVRLEVTDDVDGAFTRLTRLADRFGGSVLASEASTGDDGSLSGSVTLRVPAGDYDALLTAVSGIGEVASRSITADDVSDEYVDLESRLRHNRAQERFYLGLIDDARDVEDAIAVQQRLEGIQQTIEQLQGRLRFLDERTTFSRLTVEVVAAGGSFDTGTRQPSLAHWVATARGALVTMLGMLLVAVTVGLPLVALGVAGVLVVRRYGPALRRGPAAPAPESS